MLLALDTSTAYISVAVYDDSTDTVLASQEQVGPMQHGELLMPTIVACLSEAGIVRQDLTAVVVGVGPGPYTGLRVGVVTARTLGLALEIPVYGVCSLDAIGAFEKGKVVVSTDARRKELFWASYDDGVRVDGPFVTRPAELPDGAMVVGLPGIPVYPSAVSLARVVAGELAEIVDAEPNYLRRPDAVTPGPPKKVS